MLRLADAPPALLLAGHLEGEQAILVHRVDDLAGVIHELEARGVRIAARFEIPHGPGCRARVPGSAATRDLRVVRPETARRLEGRRDF